MPVSSNGTVYEIFGPANAPCVVLVHGLGLNRACWQWMVPDLSKQYRVLTYDLCGHGESADPPNEPSLSQFSRQLEQLLDHCFVDQAVIVGFSLGGMIARRFAQDAPDRTRALVILHSAHKRSDSAQAAILKRVEQARADGPDATVEDALERWFTDDFRQHNPQIMELVASWVTANCKDLYHRNYRVLATGVEEVVAPNPPITCPALVMTGDEDFGNGPEMTEAIASEISGAKTVILKGLRHMALAEAPQEVNGPILDFLNSLTLETGT